MVFYRVFVCLALFNIRFLPGFMFIFSLVKQLFHVLYEGRISVGTARFTLAYLGLIFDRQLTLDKFILTFTGFGVVF